MGSDQARPAPADQAHSRLYLENSKSANVEIVILFVP